MPDFIFKENAYIPAGYNVVYHDGLLWYAVYDSGESFVIAINPYDGYYEWILCPQTNEKIKSIKFNQNCMYILDYGNDLHVYEKLK
ncbi:hypothetical protein [Flavobacterium hungaricum]|uniref:Uncharacterized protein n=1 Tax=Flavobacterium hungaricum TaxID=2082725 RepID=A0ABR9TGF6_9FLAO|nr:hypothetical protein [Flavobacterium hungaricum]MBE8724443.1 hypothetical protein [Flavobacterium hungaricum]